MRIKDIVRATKGRLVSGNAEMDVEPSRFSTDSRTIKRGDFFIALKGPNFDGHRFLKDVFQKGASGAIVEKLPMDFIRTEESLIKVADTSKALADIARFHRKSFHIPIIAVTGSTGKTTVKDMIAAVLSSKYSVLKSEGTKNNHIGVPQTLLKLDKTQRMCVLEFGTNHKGEIEYLSSVANPTMAVITNIGESHLQFLGDLKDVFIEKSSLIKALGSNSVAIVNGDDKLLAGMKSKKARVIRYGLGRANNFRAADIRMERRGLRFSLGRKTEFKLNLIGLHNVYNALAAIAVASEFGVSHSLCKSALAALKPADMRLEIKRLSAGIDIIDDSYNSNPLSLERALEALELYPGDAKWVVLGDMLELGKDSVYFHRRIGRHIGRAGFNGLLTYGELSKNMRDEAIAVGMEASRLWHCSTHDEIANILRTIAKRGDVILVKGSRAMKMEEVVRKLEGAK